MHCRTKSAWIAHHNTLTVFLHSVFAEGLNFSQVKDTDTQIRTIHYNIAEIYLVLKHLWGLYATLLLCWGIRCLYTLLSYTQHYYIVVVYSTLSHLHLKLSYKDDNACLWKQLKWKKFPFYGDRLSGKNFHGD